jgi:ABC-type transport system involved in multi-copper enzyme maturation permease subunit
MTSPQIVYTLRWLVYETFRHAMASRLFWIMVGVNTLAILFCLGVRVDGGDNLRPEGDYIYHPRTNEPVTGPTHDLGELRLFFGAMRVNLARDRESSVHLLQVILASWVAGGAGLLALLVWTAGFIPEFLQPSGAAVLFTKPVPRWLVLIGRYVGVLCFVGFHVTIFFLGTWLALGLGTGVWLTSYWAGIPVLLLHFAVFYSFSVLLAVTTRSTVAAALGSILFWGICVGVNYGRHAAVALPILAPESPPLSSFTLFLADASYWVLPKPADLIAILEQALNTQAHLATLSRSPEYAAVQQLDKWDPAAAATTTLLFAFLPLIMAARQLEEIDY